MLISLPGILALRTARGSPRSRLVPDHVDREPGRAQSQQDAHVPARDLLRAVLADSDHVLYSSPAVALHLERLEPGRKPRPELCGELLRSELHWSPVVIRREVVMWILDRHEIRNRLRVGPDLLDGCGSAARA